jgi:hypothetical protein
LTALHERISRDLTELRRRLRRLTRTGDANPTGVLKAATDTARMIRALRRVSPGVGLALLVIASAVAVRRARRPHRSSSHGPGSTGL